MRRTTDSKLLRRATSERYTNVAKESQPGPFCKKGKYLRSIVDPKNYSRDETNKGLEIIQEYLATLKISHEIAKNQENRMCFDGKNRNLFFKTALDLDLAIAERLSLNKCIAEVFSISNHL